MKKLLKILILLLIVAALVIGAVKLVKKRRAQEAAMPPAKQYAVIVHTTTPRIQQKKLTIPYLALVKGEHDFTLSSKLAGRVVSIVSEGSRVKKGEVLAKIDTTPIQSKIEATKAQLQATKQAIASTKTVLANLYKIHARTKALLKVRGASKEQYEKEANQIAQTQASLANLQAKLKSLQATLEELANELSYALVKAERDGVVAKQLARVGDMAMPGKPLLKINAVNGHYLVVRLPNNQHPNSLIYKGKEYPLASLQGTFNSLKEYRTPLIDNGSLITGERVDANLVLFKGKGIFLPIDAVLNKDGQNFVFVVQGDHAKAIAVTILATGEDGVIVKTDKTILGKKVVVAKPDILLRLLSGIAIKVEDKKDV